VWGGGPIDLTTMSDRKAAGDNDSGQVRSTATETNDSQPHNWRDHAIARALFGPILGGEC